MSLLLTACGDDAPFGSVPGETTATTSAVTTSPATSSAVTTGPAGNDLSGFARAELGVGGEAWVLAVADTPVLRSQGLMGVTELVGVDGMLFVFDETISAAFWMKDTLIPLDIAFFDETGSLVDTFTMVPCEADPCPSYPAAGPFRYAVESEVGGFDGLVPLELEVPE